MISLVGSASISSVSELKEFLNGNSCSHRCFSVSRFPAALVPRVILRFLLEVTTFQLSSWWVSSISISFIAEHSLSSFSDCLRFVVFVSLFM